jgi:penicillin amidase
LILAACGSPTSTTPPSGVDLIRDDRGVPHLFGATLPDAMRGLGYATAQDRLFQMHLRRMTMRGRLAELFAVDPATDTTGDAAAFNARLVASDRAVRTLGYARHAEAVVGNLPGDIPELLAAYAAGVNAYLASPGFVLPPAFTATGITAFEPWTPADSLLVWEWVGHHFTGALGGMQAEIDNLIDCADGCDRPVCDEPLDEAAAVVPPPAGGAWPPLAMKTAANGVRRGEVNVKASHGWVVHGSKTTTGKPVLVGEPQLALEAPSTWYEYHLQADGVDARGVGVAGAPGYYVFWNQHVAQTLTAGGADIADLYELEIASDRASYVVDGTARPFAIRSETVLVRHGAPVTFEVRDTELGPVVDDVLARVPAGRSFAARHVEHVATDTHSIVAGIDIMRADSLATYRAAISHWATPAVNALYAGVDAGAADEGHIAYHALARIPIRQRVDLDGRDFTGRIPYDGSDSAAMWTEIYGIDWNPHAVDPPSGYLFSGNHLPVGSWYDDIVYGGFAGVGDTFRSLRVRQRLAELLPAGGARIDPAAIDALHFDDGADVPRVYRDMIAFAAARGIADDPGDLAAEPVSRGEKAARIRIALDAWVAAGSHLRHSEPRAPIASTVMGQMGIKARIQVNPAIACVYNGAEGGASFLAKSFDADPDAVMTPDVIDYMLQVADAAWDLVRPAMPGPDPATWTTASIPDFTVKYQTNFTCLRPGAGGVCSLVPAEEITMKIDQAYVATLTSASGSSYPVTVDHAAIDATRAFLPPGASEDPGSAFFADGLDEIVRKGTGDLSSLPVAPTDRAAIEAVATSSLHLD